MSSEPLNVRLRDVHTCAYVCAYISGRALGLRVLHTGVQT